MSATTSTVCRTSPVSPPRTGTQQWWHTAVVYQVYPRSFADSDGDGVGDLPGITQRLGHLARLGVDALWLSPFYTSPQADAGYDVADYRDVDPLFGTLADADALIERAHQLGLKVVIDLVPNHTSSEHAWFRAALAAGPGSPERARYLFREGRGSRGELPPNNWRSVFGGEGWTRVTEADGTPGQWYLHLFDTTQPDLDWSNPEVAEEFRSVLRFWLDRGVDGFRVDVAHGLVKKEGLPDWAGHSSMVSETEHGELPTHDVGDVIEDAGDADATPATHTDTDTDADADADVNDGPMWNQPGVHEVYRDWHRVLAEYGPDRMLVAEAWVEPLSALAEYVREDEMHQAFNFAFLSAHWHPHELRSVVERSLHANDAVGAPTTWVLSNHDVVRHHSRFGLPSAGGNVEALSPTDPVPDAELGLRRGRAATLLQLGLPGSAYLYQGEELGLPEHTLLPMELRQDPAVARGGGNGRDGCRVPLPWEADAPGFGFSPSGATWLPQPADWATYALDAQKGVPGSTFEMYRTALRLRRSYSLGSGGLAWVDLEDEDVVAFGNGEVVVAANTGGHDYPLPDDHEVLLASGPLREHDGETHLPPDTTVWLRRTSAERREPFGPD
ncbi:glycoside hydrolase family 13 protein [Miniimonas arenae]|uniref:Glycoside hydrolase family 13 protein n=1 Tax=Miniimonas arenae TaxID=676201 RepID=A0A5C5BGL0_9MICO|nr:glycoside hydrolase family 13 protein [Miniimonas arenae]TNU76608.1 glycoside hydrolase family 13 protein [Miniimonas arenae]